MKTTEKKEFVLEYIKLAEEFIEGNFKTIEMFSDLQAYEVLENFLFDTFLNNCVMTMAFLSPAIQKLKEDN
jgi:hypothetical protein